MGVAPICHQDNDTTGINICLLWRTTDCLPSAIRDRQSAPKEKIILVSLSANVISKHTAFVMVDTKQQVRSDLPRTILIPQATLYSSLHTDLSAMHAIAQSLERDMNLRMSLTSMMSLKKATSYKTSGSFLGNLFNGIRRHFRKANRHWFTQDKCQTMPQAGMDEGTYDFKEEEFSPSQARSNDSMLMEIIRLQKFQGSWDLNRELIDLLGVQADILKSHIPTQDDSVVATVHVIAWLRKHHLEKHDEWQMLEDKALEWLQKQDLHGHYVGELISKVTI
ncbi:hypothetical protein CHS0354_039965 [Potamilus streckersoni]|uniref:Uncharacterized protein n=1 Tax=Potamilus streckersoni TaxID=2493646 RepID=A0AAE0W5V7_9BIVA|nr:hypothetical protein CHS0354_039965 [Potamilus streckersoni]